MEKEKKVLKCIDNTNLERYLTVGRYYSVEYNYVNGNGDVMTYYILDDSGAFNYYSIHYFVASTPRSISTKDPIVEQVKEMFDKRSEVGIKKYGTTLHDNNTDDFYAHLQEELMDGILYLQKLKEMKSVFTSWVIAAFEAGYTDGFNDAQGDGIEYENAKDYFNQVIKNKI
jgi:hypothetical protein